LPIRLLPAGGDRCESAERMETCIRHSRRHLAFCPRPSLPGSLADPRVHHGRRRTRAAVGGFRRRRECKPSGGWIKVGLRDSIHARVDTYLREKSNLSAITEELIKSWLDDWIRRDLYQQASAEDLQVREFACTLVAALLGTTTSIFLQIGDGAIVVAEGAEYRPIFWPQNGEYANSTYFITDDLALDNLLFLKQESLPVDEIALFTDGLQCLALKFDTKSAHNPFFRPLFTRLRHEPPGECEVLAPLLLDFLRSRAVNERTDDDKTLLLATRLPADVVLTRSEENGQSAATI
jgi:hypothetical protein